MHKFSPKIWRNCWEHIARNKRWNESSGTYLTWLWTLKVCQKPQESGQSAWWEEGRESGLYLSVLLFTEAKITQMKTFRSLSKSSIWNNNNKKRQKQATNYWVSLYNTSNITIKKLYSVFQLFTNLLNYKFNTTSPYFLTRHYTTDLLFPGTIPQTVCIRFPRKRMHF